MGNQAIKTDLQRVMDKDFDSNCLTTHVSALWAVEGQDSLRYTDLGHQVFANMPSGDMEAQFPTQAKVEAYTSNMNSQAMTAAREAVESAGFTTSAKKLETLKQEGKCGLRHPA